LPDPRHGRRKVPICVLGKADQLAAIVDACGEAHGQPEEGAAVITPRCQRKACWVVSPDRLDWPTTWPRFERYRPSSDGHQLFALAGKGRNDDVSYDLRSLKFTPFLPDIRAFSLGFSRDGAWIAYMRSPDFSLVRVKSDGSQPLVLVNPPGVHPERPTWSPDGRADCFRAPKTKRNLRNLPCLCGGWTFKGIAPGP